MKRVKLLSILLCLLVVLFPSCNGNNTSPEATGSITVKIEDSTTIGGGENARGVEPQNYEVASYEILASGPEGAQQSADLKKGTSEHTFSNVAPGNWSITVNAYTENGETIGSGKANVTVTPGQNASCSIEVKEIQGKGDINFNITDSTGALTALTAEISNDNGIVATAELNKDDQNIFSGSVKVDNGFYMVSVKAGENEILKVDSVRVYADITTIYNGTYDGETIDVTVTDEIIKTPDLTLTITSGASVAANGTLTASATVTNLENPSYAWYINGTKLENSTDSDLSYQIEGSAYAEEEALEVTVFVSNGSIIWSESKTVTVTEAVTLPSEVTISQDKTAYGSEITLSYETEENIPEGTAATWTIKGTVIENATFTPSIIGHEIPVSLTLNAGGVTQTYTSSIEINPVVSNFNVTPVSVPEKAVLAVESTVNAPEDAVISAVIGEESIPVTDGKITLPDGLSGEISISWNISYNDESWTSATPVTVTVAKSEATEKPEINTDSAFGGATDDEKEKTVENVLNALSESGINFLETSDGDFNLDRTIEKVNEGYKYYGFSSGNYIFWGSKNGSSVDVTVSDKTNVFTIRAEGTSYILNGVTIVTIPTEAPELNTKPGFGGNAGERYNLVMSIYNEIMEAVWYEIPDRMEFADGNATMTGLQTRSYIIWGSAIVDPSSFVLSSANVTVMDLDGNIFEITTENGTFYINGEICEQPKAGEPVAPTERYPGNAREEIGSEEQNIISIAHDVFTGSSIIMPAIMYNIPEGEYSVGNYKITIHDIKTGNAEITVINDIPDASITDDDWSFLGTATILKNSYFISSSMSEEYAEVSFIYDGKTYSCTYTCIYGLGSDEIDCTVYDSNGNVVNDEQIQNIANGVVDFISTDSSSAIFSQEIVEKLYNLLLYISDEATIIITELDMPGGLAMPTSMDYIASFEGYKTTTHTEEGYIEYTLSTPGFHVTTKDSDMKGSLHGPLNVNGTDYYIDVQYQQGFKGSIEGGIKVNGVWKAVTV